MSRLDPFILLALVAQPAMAGPELETLTDVSFRAAAGWDSDASLQRTDDGGTGLFLGDLVLAAGVRGRLPPVIDDFNPPRRYWRLTLDLEAAGFAQVKHEESEPLDLGAGLSYDRDLAVGNKTLAKLAVGGRLAYVSRDLGGEPVLDTASGTGALMFTWKARGRCELDRTIVFASREEHHAPLDGDGHSSVLGVAHTWTIGEPMNDLPCEGAGIFRNEIRRDLLTLVFHPEYRRDRPDGNALDSRELGLRVRAHVPLGHRLVWSLDGTAEYARVDFGSREGEGYLAELELRRSFLGPSYRSLSPRRFRWNTLDLRMGVSTYWGSDLAAFGSDRTVVFFGVEGRLGGWVRNGVPIVTAGGSSRVDQRRDQSGTSRPRVPD